MKRLAVNAAASVAVLLAALFVCDGRAEAAQTQVTTIAGSGAAGFADGPPGQASFMMPEGLATDKQRNIYVADVAAQRIRVVAPNGTVTTLAGSGAALPSGLWVAGGYRDGPAAQAQFNKPSAVAVANDGTVYVADANNHCIRKIKDGVVSTYAGAPGISPHDGPLSSAGFGNPSGLAIDREENIYVADLYVGLRKISKDGNVTTIPLTNDVPLTFGMPVVTGVSTFATPKGDVIFVASPGVMFRIDPEVAAIDTRVAGLVVSPKQLFPAPLLQGYRTPGYPYAMVALSRYACIYADPVTNTVRVSGGTIDYPLGATPTEDAPSDGSGYLDGDVKTARYNEPMGIALDGGRIVVADTGNRRIRLIALPSIQRGAVASPDPLAALAGRKEQDYTIAYLGNSSSYYNTLWEDSIPGVLESRLNHDAAALGLHKHVHVLLIPLFGVSASAMTSFVRTVLADTDVNLVVWQFNSGFVNDEHKRSPFVALTQTPRSDDAEVTSELRSVRNALQSRGIPFVVVLHPLPFEISPIEDPYYRSFEYLPYEQFAGVGKILHDAIAASGSQLVDLFPVFLKVEQAPTHPALFATRDVHFSVQGTALVATTVAQEIERLQPWAATLPHKE